MDWFIPAGAHANAAWYIPIVMVAVCCTGFGKAGFAGLGTLPVPVMLMVVEEGRIVIGMWLPILIFADLLTIRHYPRQCEWRLIGGLIPGSVAGILIGVLVMGRIPSGWLKLAIGVLLLVFVAVQVARGAIAARIGARREPWRPGLTASATAGLLAGFCTAVAHAAGSIVTMYLLPQRLEPRVFVGTAARYFFLVNVLKVPFYVHGGLITSSTLKATLWLLPLAPPAAWLGAAVNRRLSNSTFTRIVYGLLTIAGIKLVADQMLG